MRLDKEDVKYQDFKDIINDSMKLDIFGEWAAYKVTDYIFEEYNYFCKDTTLFLMMLALSKYEIENNCLEDRVRVEMTNYLQAYGEGKFDGDLFDFERFQVSEDIAFIQKKLKD